MRHEVRARESPPVPLGRRSQIELGIQQGLGRWLVADFGYFNERADNASPRTLTTLVNG